jgi:hypothetical protein
MKKPTQVKLLWILVLLNSAYIGYLHSRQAVPRTCQSFVVVGKDGRTPKIRFDTDSKHDFGQIVFFGSNGRPVTRIGFDEGMWNESGPSPFSIEMQDSRGKVRVKLGVTSDGFGILSFPDDDGFVSISAFAIPDTPRVTFQDRKGRAKLFFEGGHLRFEESKFSK